MRASRGNVEGKGSFARSAESVESEFHHFQRGVHASGVRTSWRQSRKAKRSRVEARKSVTAIVSDRPRIEDHGMVAQPRPAKRVGSDTSLRTSPPAQEPSL